MTAHARYGRTTGVALLMRRRLAAPQRCPRPWGGSATFSTPAARSRRYPALAASTLQRWTLPKAHRPHGTPYPAVAVSSLLATRAGLLADGEFSRLAGVSVEGFGLFPPVGAADAHAAAVEGT